MQSDKLLVTRSRDIFIYSSYIQIVKSNF